MLIRSVSRSLHQLYSCNQANMSPSSSLPKLLEAERTPQDNRMNTTRAVEGMHFQNRRGGSGGILSASSTLVLTPVAMSWTPTLPVRHHQTRLRRSLADQIPGVKWSATQLSSTMPHYGAVVGCYHMWSQQSYPIFYATKLGASCQLVTRQAESTRTRLPQQCVRKK